MQGKNELLRGLPKVDELMMRPQLQLLQQQAGHMAVLLAARQVLDDLRAGVLAGGQSALPAGEDIAHLVALEAEKLGRPKLQKVINATGVVLHTNLGRALLSEKAAAAAGAAARHYANLEYNIEAGRRGSRHSLVSGLMCELCGAEDAMVVNNNAGAVLLMLAALAPGKEVVVSRGELVEIGGAFRVPDIMALSGARLREVGTTNRTHPKDYENAINDETGALLKVHTSNFRVVGFTQEVTLAELTELGKRRGLPVLYDLGGGLLRRIEGLDIPGEPCVVDSLKAGADVLCFSGDKLLGGPQAGIVLGKAAFIERMKSHPLARALRADKMTLAALESTLLAYRDEDVARLQIPTLRMLTATPETLRAKAEKLAAMLAFLPGGARVVQQESQVGGGTSPGFFLPTAAVAIGAHAMEPERLESRLRFWKTPIVARIARDTVLLDMRTVAEEDFEAIVLCLRCVFAAENKETAE